MSGRMAHFFFARKSLQTHSQDPMALSLDQIRALAQRVAASHGLDVVEVEYQGRCKDRILRVFIEKNAEERARTGRCRQKKAAARGSHSHRIRQSSISLESRMKTASTSVRISGRCLMSRSWFLGGDYTLEVSSPGLDRKLHGVRTYQRFSGSLVKLQTFEPVAGNRHWQGRLTAGERTRHRP